MKNVTQKDFQNLYKSPEYEQTEEMRRTLAKLPDRKRTERGAVIRKRRVAFVLAAVMVLMGIVAVAVTNPSSILVTWGAKQTEEVKSAGEIRAEELSGKMLEIIENAPDDVRIRIIATDPGQEGEKPIRKTAASVEELQQILDTAGYPHPDRLLPEGWSFSTAWVNYECDADGTYELIGETVQDDLTVQQYRLDEQHRVAVGYTVRMEKGSGQATIQSDYTTRMGIEMEFSFPAEEENKVRAETFSVPGMEEALAIGYGEETFLSMYRKLDKPVTFGEKVNTEGLAEETAAAMTEPAGYELIMFRGLEPEEAASLFAGNP